jgi:hypothetical protein
MRIFKWVVEYEVVWEVAVEYEVEWVVVAWDEEGLDLAIITTIPNPDTIIIHIRIIIILIIIQSYPMKTRTFVSVPMTQKKKKFVSKAYVVSVGPVLNARPVMKQLLVRKSELIPWYDDVVIFHNYEI